MESTKIATSIQKTVDHCMDQYTSLREIVQHCIAAGARPFLVGGAVRDLLLGRSVTDVDIEMHNVTADQLEQMLSAFGTVNVVGKSFGVMRVGLLDVDWSLPRTDSAGRKPVVTVDPHMGIKQACRRRDLTMNAMAIDLSTYALHDPFGGQEDMACKRLRTPDAQLFVEDPLRFYRVMQMVSRFEMMPDQTLNQVCMTMDLSTVALERIEQEFEKMIMLSARPSLGIRWLREIKRVHELFPELGATIGVMQDPIHHPEGDVFEHLMQAVDAAARSTGATDEQTLIVRYAALCHDLGKVEATQLIDGRISHRGHAAAGEPLARRMLGRITRKKEMVDAVCRLVFHHMDPLTFIRCGAKAAAYKRLARALHPHASIAMLAALRAADESARNGQSTLPLTGHLAQVALFVERAQQAGVYESMEQPLLLGRDLIDVVGDGPALGALLKRAYTIQIEENIADKEELKKRLLQ